MKTDGGSKTGFTLIELLVVIAIIAILAALLFPVISSAKTKAKRATCLSNLRQINLGVRMYSDDSADKAPSSPPNTNSYILDFSGYKKQMKSYVGLNGASSRQDTLFACPADRFYYEFSATNQVFVPQSWHEQVAYDNSSYWFNSGTPTRFGTNSPGIAGRNISSIKHPEKTVLVAEMPAFHPWSWHDPKRPLPTGNEWPLFKDAKNNVSFVDGHVSYIKIYWEMKYSPTAAFDPPAGYDYKWSGD
jgi:prepilin-type N-terminal cleavage/methylation domain-containing protein/prepilin-type processing-associated H-X9-DG protein